MKKLVALFLSLMMVIGLMTVSASAEAPPVITIAVSDATNIEDFNTNTMTLQLEEATGTDIEFVIYPATDYNTKITMMISTGGAELPDVIFANPNNAEIISWVESGVLLPLNEYYADAEKSPYIHAAIENTGVDFREMITMYDGNIYTIPSFNQTYNSEYPTKAWLNTAWLEQLGIEAPTTPEELYDMLVLVKNTDLNGNGKADEIGMVGNFIDHMGWFQYMMNAFVYAGDNSYHTVTDGVVNFAYMTEEWKEGLKYINKLFAEDLLPKEILTQDNNQFLAMLNSEECTTMMLFYSSPSRVNATNTWRDDFEGYPPLNGPDGTPLATYKPSVPSNGAFFITKNCTDPDAAFRIGDAMISTEFSIITRWGQEGEDWDYVENIEGGDKLGPWVEGFEPLFQVYDDATFWSSGEMQNRSLMQKGPYIREYGIANGRAIDPETVSLFDKHTGAADNLYQLNEYRPDEVVPKLVYSADEVDAVADIQATLTDFIKEWTANFLSGNLDIDGNWDAFQQELENIGVHEVLEVVQAVYDRMYK